MLPYSQKSLHSQYLLGLIQDFRKGGSGLGNREVIKCFKFAHIVQRLFPSLLSLRVPKRGGWGWGPFLIVYKSIGYVYDDSIGNIAVLLLYE